MVRVRFAPSPTGIPHIGNTRTALFNYLFAKKNHGQFILRIEDTDQKRLNSASLTGIIKILRSLGLKPDKPPVFQSKRLKLYHQYAQKLVAQGSAVKDGRAVRFKPPLDQDITWNDLIQGPITINTGQLHQAVLLKSDGFPTYHLAVVVDDHLMKISHVLRGSEWISSNPIHLLLYQAFNWEPPQFGHFPVILGPDKTKLSKRHGAKSILDYQSQGYLNSALISFMVYLGWSYQDNSRLLTLTELTKLFSLKKVHQTNPIFDIQKLDYFNGKAIRSTSNKQLFSLLKPFIPKSCSQSLAREILPLVKGRLVTLADFADLSSYFYQSISVDKKLLLKQSNQSPLQLDKILTVVIDQFSKIPSTKWTVNNLETTGRRLLDQTQLNPRQLFMTIRVAVTGRLATPPLFDTLKLIGREKILKRLRHVQPL